MVRVPASRRNALADGHRLGYVNYRDHTPLPAARSTTRHLVVAPAWCCGSTSSRRRCARATAPIRPTGAGAPDPGADPGRAVLDDELVDELAAEPALTLLCGRYEGFDERIVDTSRATGSRSAATCSPVVSSRRWSSATRSCASNPARSAMRSRHSRSPSAARSRAPRISALHPPGRVPRLAGPRGAALGAPREHPSLAAGTGARARSGLAAEHFAFVSLP